MKPSKELTLKEIVTNVLVAGAEYGKSGRYFAGKSDIDKAVEQIERLIAKERIEWLDEQIAKMLENVYPLDVFPRNTKGGTQEQHMAGIYHGIHILRREARELSAREDLPPVPQETEEYYADLRKQLTDIKEGKE